MYKKMLNWLQKAPVADALDHRNAVAMQIVFIIIGIVLPGVWIERLWVGQLDWQDRVFMGVHLSVTLLGWISLALIRAGFLRFASALFLVNTLALILGLYAVLGLEGQRVTQLTQVFPLAVAGVVFGRRALWCTLLFLLVCLLCGAWHDLNAAGFQGQPLKSVGGMVITLGLSFLVVAVIFDSAVAAIRASLVDIQIRGRELEAAKRRIREEKEEREQAMEQLIHGQKMKAVGQLAGGVAHDFNNVLGVILGYAQWRQRYSQPEELKEALAGVENAARRGAAVSRKLLSFSRHDLGHQEVFDVGEALRLLEGMLRQLFDPRVLIEVELMEAGLPIRFDRGQFELAILNIATNARDAMPSGGRFRVVVGLSGAASSVPWVEVRLSDTGQGMSEAVRRRIFEPFFTTKPDGGGTGLGLAVVGKVVSESGGQIRVESEPGKGACFTLCFPLAEMGGAGERTDGSAPRVLLVDDDDELRAMLAMALEEGGCQVLCAKDGGEAERLVRRGDVPDVLVTDYRMPGMNGLMLIHRLRISYPDMPMILISDYMPEAGSLAGRLPPDVERLPKPFSPDLLLKYVYMLTSWSAERGEGEGV